MSLKTLALALVAAASLVLPACGGGGGGGGGTGALKLSITDAPFPATGASPPRAYPWRTHAWAQGNHPPRLGA